MEYGLVLAGKFNLFELVDIAEVDMNPLKKAKRNLKRDIAKATGIPTTKSGRKRKLKNEALKVAGIPKRGGRGKSSLLGNGWFWLIVIIAAVVLLNRA